MTNKLQALKMELEKFFYNNYDEKVILETLTNDSIISLAYTDIETHEIQVNLVIGTMELETIVTDGNGTTVLRKVEQMELNDLIKNIKFWDFEELTNSIYDYEE